ncbi:MAG: permease of the major facilitator superfamily [Caulobacter sp.]|nr:permease of the major facilitator superfamily [Caulobacter sp.]
MTDDTAPKAAVPKVPLNSWWSVSLLLVLYILSVIDRGALTMMVEPIKADLHITDFQMALVLGPAFAICYATLGIPLGWAADRFPRRWVVFAGVSVWSLSLTLTGLAHSFLGLLAGRVGVAVGEASLSPAAYSLIGDKFPKERLTTALGVYGMGPKLGLAASYSIGAIIITLTAHMGVTHIPGIGALQPWQMALVMLGLPGVLLAALVFTITEPSRTRAETAAPRASLLPYLIKDWRALLPIFLGFTLANICGQALQQWVPTFLTRRFDLEAAQYAPVMSALSFVAALTVLFKGIIVDWLYRRGVKDAHIRFYTWLLAVTIVPLTAAFFVSQLWLFYVCIAFAFIGTLSFLVYAVAALQMLGPPELRGQLSAVLLLCVSGISPSISPVLVGALTDFVFQDDAAIGTSMAIVCVGALVAALITLRLALKPIRDALARRQAEDGVDA